MQTLLLKLQADVESRKQQRPELAATFRSAVIGCLLFSAAYYLGARSTAVGQEWDASPSWVAGLTRMPGDADYKQMQIDRLDRIYRNSARYHIPADLAAAIEDVALAEKIKPDLAFQLVRTESEFNARAVSPVGAVGYTQLMPATARLMEPGITRERLFDRDTNLRLGFRFLRGLLVKYDGDMHMALLAYNRGPDLVDSLVRNGRDPNNGYPQLVLRDR
ncbi:MAG: Lytic transglycosylase catalytic [Gemmatimonadetes bacterium]|nr:Lytic transglycosylase catalytic [Gemmatimonadota bacterium]